MKRLTLPAMLIASLGMQLSAAIVQAAPPQERRCKGNACDSLEVEYTKSDAIIVGVRVTNNGNRKVKFRVDVENPYGSVQELEGVVGLRNDKSKYFQLNVANQNIGGALKRANLVP